MLDWCINNLGGSEFQSAPPKICVSNKIPYHNFGEYDYDKNKIFIYLLMHTSISELCDTVIHEYRHYQQDADQYDKLEMNKGQNNNINPFELEANLFAEKYRGRLKEHITKINKNGKRVRKGI